MHLSSGTRWILRLGTALTLAFLYVPLLVIGLYAFNERRVQTWPIPGFTLEWFDKAFHNPGVRDALETSVKAALGATGLALLLGTLAAIAVSRYRFFGRETISFLVILPIALPGIVTGMALNATFREVLEPFGLSGPGFGNVATWLVFSYLWLPFMVLPIYAGLERIPNSMLDASGDLGGRPWMTFRRVVMPLALPAVVAGSIFTFSLTLGDYIAPTLVSSTQFIGNVVYTNVGVANNLPLAAAFATVPVAIMIVYLLIARRLGAFESL